MAQAPERVAPTESTQSIGRIVQITGPVVDVEFEEGQVPDIYTALEVVRDGEGADQHKLVFEVMQSLGNNWVRTVSMAPTEGLARGARVLNTGQPIKAPVGEGVLG